MHLKYNIAVFLAFWRVTVEAAADQVAHVLFLNDAQRIVVIVVKRKPQLCQVKRKNQNQNQIQNQIQIQNQNLNQRKSRNHAYADAKDDANEPLWVFKVAILFLPSNF